MKSQADHTTPEIKAATYADIPEIVKISESYRIDKIQKENAVQKGFLVSGFNACDYETFIRQKEIFQIILQDKEIAGFILGYDDVAMDEKDPVRIEILKRIDKPFFMIKQICIHKKWVRKGFAGLLYQSFIKETKPCPVLAAIVHDPPNEASMAFHTQMGFKPLFEFFPEDKMKRVMWLKKG